MFGREDAGFDVIVGNPPFAGKNTFITGHHAAYPDYLKAIHPDSHGNSDLVAHFFRRAYTLLRLEGCFGLITTKTIRQGDTRATGLRWICNQGGVIYSARRRSKWPGRAAVVISIVHISKRGNPEGYELDGAPVNHISAFLFHKPGNDDPLPLHANKKRCFVGSYVLGLGFTLVDTDVHGKTNSLDTMRSLVAKNQRNAERIFPYINGSDVNDHPAHSAYRYIINFGQMTEDEARKWPDLLSLVESTVKPGRLAQNRSSRAKYWWRFAETAPNLYRAISGLQQVLVRSLTSTYFPTFTFLPAGMVYDQTLLVFPSQQYSAFAVLCSRLHEEWSIFFGGSMKDDPRYNVESCFETFPLPPGFDSDDRLMRAGETYYRFRAQLMIKLNEGMTKLYARFNNPSETMADIVQLRELHTELDRATLSAYGGNLSRLDVVPCDFLLDYEEEEEEEDGRRQKRKPWRYRWPESFRDEVLALLLDLHEQRAEEEKNAIPTKTPSKPKGKQAGRQGKSGPSEGGSQASLFGE